ncbi:unnamed protein product [Caenorhabditis angaria]|uniref:Uncharacterized protein n=1 Tax=Caenorhabditis angaria TaxID=860376 RepID=A0A9P1IS00_9PELO|nr:unnamed protein product [Caenorhabditis angaria]
MILYFVLLFFVEGYDKSDAEKLLKKIWSEVPGLAENKLDDYIHHLFEYTNCEGEVKNRTDFIKIILETSKSLKIDYVDEVGIIVKSYRHTKGKSYPEYSTQPYLLFDVKIAGFSGSFGFSARKKEGGFLPELVLDKVINYNCDPARAENQVKFQNYAYFITASKLLNKIARSDDSSKYIRDDFTLYSCPEKPNDKPIESFKWLLQNTKGDLRILDLKKITKQKWESGTLLRVTMEYQKGWYGQYTNNLMVTTASEITC